MPTDPSAEQRTPLNRERVLRAAAALADEAGIESLTMRRLAQDLGVEAMSLYNHVANKDDLLDGLVDLIVGGIAISPRGGDWRTALRQQAFSARTLMLRHPWAPGLITSRRQISHAMLHYMDSALGTLLQAGFSSELANHAIHIIGSRLLGFVQGLFDPGDLGPQVAKIFLNQLAEGEYANLAKVISEMRHTQGTEFEFGLDLILDGLERLRDTA